MPTKKPAKKTAAKTAAAKKPLPTRLPPIPGDKPPPAQRALGESTASAPRGKFKMGGPFYCYLHAPGFGERAQTLGPLILNWPRGPELIDSMSARWAGVSLSP